VATSGNGSASQPEPSEAWKVVVAYDDPSTDFAPTRAQINALLANETSGGKLLGTDPVSDDALAAVLAAIDAANSDGNAIASQQELADAAQTVLDYDIPTTDTAPTKDQINALVSGQTAGGTILINPVTSDTLAAVQAAIDAANSGTSPIASQQEPANVVQAALSALTAAQDNTANANTPGIGDYAALGVTGVNAANLAALNSALDTSNVNGAAVDSAASMQTIVNAYNKIFAAADGTDANAAATPTAADYTAIGVGLNATTTQAQAGLLSDVIDGKGADDVNTVAEVQALVDAANRLNAMANGHLDDNPGLDADDIAAPGLSALIGFPASLSLFNQTIDTAPASALTGPDPVEAVTRLASIASLVQQTAAGTVPRPALGENDLLKLGLQNIDPDLLSNYLGAIGGTVNSGTRTALTRCCRC
jgi:hypothetical protein